jgi:hypothetical protein
MEQSEQELLDANYRRTATDVEELLYQSYNQAPPDDYRVADYLWTESDEELGRLLQKNNIRMLTGPACYEIKDANGLIIGAVVHLYEEDRKKLGTATPESMLRGKDLDRFLSLVEETSHFVYQNYYWNKFGEPPHHAMTELVAVLDKYNVMEGMFQKHYGREMNKREEALVIDERKSGNAAEIVGKTDPVYAISHRLGGEYMAYLNGLMNHGYFSEVEAELEMFMGMKSSDQMKHLCYDLGLTFDTYGEAEKNGVEKVMGELGVSVLRR